MPTEPTVLSLVDTALISAPRNVAVSAPDGTLTFEQLSARAELVADRLRRLGVQPGDLVGQCVERSASLVVAALGIVKAGAAYVAIDPRYPDERVRWMLDDSGASAVITDTRNASRVGASNDCPAVVLAEGGEQIDGAHAASPEAIGASPRAADLAYVVYTSGSTGRPKGVLVEHGSLLNLVRWHRDAFGLDAGDRCTQIASPGFDAAVWEIWPSLASAAAIHIVPEELRADPVALRNWLVEEGITVSFLPTAIAEGVIGLAWPKRSAMRYLLTGGDALSRRPSPELGFIVVNNYGLSETTVVATSGVVRAEGEGLPSIGRPIAGVTAEVVDERLQPVGPGLDGELLIGGAVVGRGYLGRPELTAERFLDGPQGRRYRTGDRVRLLPGGEIEFLGRVDDQLSIRGFRVEPGEIVATLNAHPAIESSVVVGAGASADRQLVAYAVAANGERPDSDQLAEFLGRSLPEYMVPARYVWLDELPVTAHGKIDRAALPEPATQTVKELPGRRARTPIEARIGEIVAKLLGIETVGPNQNFFLLGGHSMLGAQLIARLTDVFDVEISLRFLFDHPTPAQLAVEAERQSDAHVAGVSVAG